MQRKFTYLALGDSYTIGEAVMQPDSFPFQLVAYLNLKGMSVETPVIIARTGWTTDELQAAISSADPKQKFDFVTLLIGVNNQYRGYTKEIYRKEFAELLQTAIFFSGGDETRVFVVSVPDWGVTPFGQSSKQDPRVIADEIDAFNVINKEESLRASVSYTDITPASRKAALDLSLVASDGLHPSSKMYQDWAAEVASSVRKRFDL